MTDPAPAPPAAEPPTVTVGQRVYYAFPAPSGRMALAEVVGVYGDQYNLRLRDPKPREDDRISGVELGTKRGQFALDAEDFAD